ncbi:MAG: type II toxin-antitoxin system prevent-host-death family antitoxin [Bacteroidota bacterium]|nr:type II toxin-antitoxin system prevent-host-death family antitoxin [Bacteroidota bacterium]
MEVLNYTEFRKELKSFLDKVSKDEEVIVVSRGKNKNVVVISLNEYNSLKETLYLLSSEKNRKRLQESIDEMKKGKFSSHSLIED